MQTIFAVFLLAVSYVANAEVDWDALRISWNPNPFSSYAFTKMPLDTRDAVSEGFAFKDHFCGSDTRFRGNRYWKDNDPAVILIYDGTGQIAGIQTAVRKDKLTPSKFLMGHPFVEDGDYYTLTAYFVDPSTICEGRGLLSSPIGDRLILQNGTNALRNALSIPLTLDEVEMTSWTRGKCFWTMGLHFWYNVRSDMPCSEFAPFFLLYNKNKLNAFGFAVNAGLTSPRYEHPTAKVAKQFIDPMPECFFTDPTFAELSTMHIYMTDWARSSFC